ARGLTGPQVADLRLRHARLDLHAAQIGDPQQLLSRDYGLADSHDSRPVGTFWNPVDDDAVSRGGGDASHDVTSERVKPGLLLSERDFRGLDAGLGLRQPLLGA